MGWVNRQNATRGHCKPSGGKLDSQQGERERKKPPIAEGYWRL